MRGDDRVAGLYVSDPGGSLAVYAGGNTHTAGAQIVSAGSVELTAKGDITLDSVTTGQSETIRWSSRTRASTAAAARPAPPSAAARMWSTSAWHFGCGP